jgi:hypothetical protein
MTPTDPLTQLFETAEREHPDLMEPHSARLAEASTVSERVEVMRAGLRETFRRRYPMPDEFWPKAKAVSA